MCREQALSIPKAAIGIRSQDAARSWEIKDRTAYRGCPRTEPFANWRPVGTVKGWTEIAVPEKGPENAGPQKHDRKLEDKLPKAIT